MNLRADRDKCVTAGLCVLTAPEVFTQDDEQGTVVLLVDGPAADVQSAVREAVDLCPSGAIWLVDEDEDQQ